MPGQRLIGAFTLLDEYLHERTGFGRGFPWQRTLTGGQLDDDVADPLGLTNLEHHILRQVIAFVEQAERSDAVLDRGAIIAFHHRRAGSLAGEGFRHFGRHRLGSFIAAAVARRQRNQSRQPKQVPKSHKDQASGVHGS